MKTVQKHAFPPRPLDEYKKLLEDWKNEYARYKSELDAAVSRLKKQTEMFSELVSSLVKKNGNGKAE